MTITSQIPLLSSISLVTVHFTFSLSSLSAHEVLLTLVSFDNLCPHLLVCVLHHLQKVFHLQELQANLPHKERLRKDEALVNLQFTVTYVEPYIWLSWKHLHHRYSRIWPSGRGGRVRSGGQRGGVFETKSFSKSYNT